MGKSSNLLSVSVVVPCYNCADVIERAIKSVAEQTQLPRSVILIDDASMDDGATLKQLYALKEKYTQVLHIVVISLKKNRGPSVARNIGWDAATESHIAFLDADDSWLPHKLEVQYNWMQSMPDISLCGHVCEWEGISNGREQEQFDHNIQVSNTIITKKNLLVRTSFSTPSVMLKRSLPFRFHEEKRHAEDYYLWLQVVCSDYGVARLDIPLAILHKAPYGEDGLSADLWAMEKGVQDVYCRLRSDGLLGVGEFWGVRLFSLVKYLRRLLMANSMLRKRRQCR